MQKPPIPQLLFYCILLVFSTLKLQAQTNTISILQINNQNITKVKVVNQVIDLTGSISILEEVKKYQVQIGVNRNGEEGWQILDKVILKDKSWYCKGIPIGEICDNGGECNIIAFLMLKEFALPVGLIHQSYLGETIVAKSKSVSVKLEVKKAKTTNKVITPTIRINYIGNTPVTSRDVKNVEREEILRGEVVKEEKHFVQIIVQPLKTSNRWAMDTGTPSAFRRSWSGKAFFGLEGFHDYHEFSVYAIITKNMLPASKFGIPFSDWQQYMESQIVVISPEIFVRRTHNSYNEIDIAIKSIGDKIVYDNKINKIDQTSNIIGYVSKRPIKSVEKIYLFSISKTNNGISKLIGKPSRKGGYNWELPPKWLGTVGEVVKIIAVITEEDITSLEQVENRNKIIFSKPILVSIEDDSSLEVKITHINDIEINQNQPYLIPNLPLIKGVIFNNKLTKNYYLSLFKYTAEGGKQWVKLNSLLIKNSNWSFFYTDLRSKDEEIVLVVVVTDKEIQKITPSDIIAFSNKITVKVQ